VLRHPLLAPLLIALGCTRLQPSGSAAGPQRSFANTLEETIAAVRQAVPQTGLLVEHEGAIDQNEWALSARTAAPGEAEVRVRVAVRRAGSGSRVAIEQITLPARDPADGRTPSTSRNRRASSADYAARINALLDQKLRRS
jgi:hypothetical protein